MDQTKPVWILFATFENFEKPRPSIKKRNISVEEPTIILIIFRDFLMFYQILLSPQVKRSAVITYKHGI